jgi:hypothetical protein
MGRAETTAMKRTLLSAAIWASAVVPALAGDGASSGAPDGLRDALLGVVHYVAHVLGIL